MDLNSFAHPFFKLFKSISITSFRIALSSQEMILHSYVAQEKGIFLSDFCSVIPYFLSTKNKTLLDCRPTRGS